MSAETDPTPPAIAPQRIRVEVNGSPLTRDVAPRTHLVDFLRDGCGLTGAHLGCEHGVCGACTVQLDGQLVRGCLVLAVQADGGRVLTAETPSPSPALRALQDAFIARNALQCGYCTSGMLVCALALVEQHPNADRTAVRAWISGNYCRCTGYHAIVDAICDVLQAQREGRLGQPAAAGSAA
jgi:carbon-monoxide dehydrogenase small subunit